MSWRLDNRRKWVLLGMAALALFLQVLLEHTKAPARQRDYELKLTAAELAYEAFLVLRDHRLLTDAHVEMPDSDPAGTGLIGPQQSEIINAGAIPGSLEAKQTSLNPNWAAVMVQYFRQLGLGPGDPVAVALSSSFPGLNIALFAAIETMRLRPVVVTSGSASSWGASDPSFTWLDMETILYDKGVFTTRSQLVTLGGNDDAGNGLSKDGRRLIAEAATRHGAPLMDAENIEQAIDRRMAFYTEQARGRGYRCYVNIGGGIASMGHGSNRHLLKSGLNTELGRHNWPRKGTMVLFTERGVPVIHLLRIAPLAKKHGLPIAPDYLAEPGEGDILVKEMYRLPLVALLLVFYCLLCARVLAPELRRGLFDMLPGRRPRQIPREESP